MNACMADQIVHLVIRQAERRGARSVGLDALVRARRRVVFMQRFLQRHQQPVQH